MFPKIFYGNYQTGYDLILSWTPEASIPSLDDDSYVDISSQGDHDGMPFVRNPSAYSFNGLSINILHPNSDDFRGSTTITQPQP